jgi:hypothetical protein
VVLNSAERAPFLLHVEILEGDLDFDPTRRENRELLKKIVVQEDLRKRKKEEGGPVDSRIGMRTMEGFGSPMPETISTVIPQTPGLNRNGNANGKNGRQDARPHTDAAVERVEAAPDDMEEMDLVEQLYGAKLSVRDAVPDLSDSIPLPSAPRNKQLDLAAWDRAAPEASGSGRSPLMLGLPLAWAPETPNPPMPATMDSPASLSPAAFTPGVISTPDHNSPKRTITLEDYSERMRTAAVMLAQLNASLVPAIPEGQPAAAGSKSWIPGTGWITKNVSKEMTPPGGDAPTSAGGKLKLAAAQAAAIRERIMEEMMALEEERVARMTDREEGVAVSLAVSGMVEDARGKTAEDEGIVRRELNKADPSGESNVDVWV